MLILTLNGLGGDSQPFGPSGASFDQLIEVPGRVCADEAPHSLPVATQPVTLDEADSPVYPPPMMTTSADAGSRRGGTLRSTSSRQKGRAAKALEKRSFAVR
jgi:hypothetical protein